MLVAEKERSVLPNVDHVPLQELPIDDFWRSAVRAKMKELGVNQHELAAHVGCQQSNISHVLSFERQQSRSLHTQRISESLGVALTLPAQGELLVGELIKKDASLAKTMIDSWGAIAAKLDNE